MKVYKCRLFKGSKPVTTYVVLLCTLGEVGARPLAHLSPTYANGERIDLFFNNYLFFIFLFI